SVVPRRDARVDAGNEASDADPQCLVADCSNTDRAVTAYQEQTFALARSRLRDERFGYRDDPVDQIRGSVQPPPVEGPALRTPHFAASPRLGPVDYDPVLVERVRRQAVAPDPAKCLGIGSGLNTDRQEERDQRG